MDGDLNYCNPPVVMSPIIMTAEQLTERIDWGLENHGIPETHQVTKGDGVKIGVLDTGRPVHEDIGDVAFSYNFTRSPTDEDRQGHATHVCGTIRALENGKGVLGVAPKALIGTVKVLGDDGYGSNAWIAKGIYKCIDEKCDIISMSLGGPYDPGIEQACLDAIQSGIYVICAAGNEGSAPGQNTISWPARLRATIAIAAYNRDGVIADFSSRGPEIDFAFPGENILSTWPGNKYRVLSGTSMATPFASATVALILSYFRKHAADRIPKTNTQLRELLREYSRDMGVSGRDNAWGFGIPDINGIVRSVRTINDQQTGWISFGSLSFKFPAELDGKSGLFISFQ